MMTLDPSATGRGNVSVVILRLSADVRTVAVFYVVEQPCERIPRPTLGVAVEEMHHMPPRRDRRPGREAMPPAPSSSEGRQVRGLRQPEFRGSGS